MLCPPESVLSGGLINEYIVDVSQGVIELVAVQEWRGSRLYMGGYSITRDLAGKEIDRTPITWHGYSEWN